MNRRLSFFPSSVLLACAFAAAAPAHSATPPDLLTGYSAQAGAPAQPARGQAFFTGTHGREWSCSSCHTQAPTASGKHASTGKTIAPLAPAVNAERFTDYAKAEKWFRRNCMDVAGRECTAGEKADILSWLLTLRP